MAFEAIMERRTKNVVYPPSAAPEATREQRTGGLPAAFTLLEVMIVIGIIAILVGLLFPVIIGVTARAKQKQAMAETSTILMAIKAYRQEYGKWPAQIQAVQDTTYVTNNYLVIQPLLGSNLTIGSSQMNPKNKLFLNLQVSTNGNPDYAGNYLDPWGIPYVICMDENGNNGLSIVWSNMPPYAASNTLPWNSWTEMP